MHRRSRGNMKAADQQRDSFNVVLRYKMNVEAGQILQAIPIRLLNEDEGYNEDTPIVVKNTGCAFVNIYDVIRKSDYFKNISGLYDQLKINMIKVDITAIDWPNAANETNPNDNGYVYPKSLSVVTAWDRSGISESQIQYLYGVPNKKDPIYRDVDDNEVFEDVFNRSDRKFYCTVGNEITSYSSSIVRHLGPGSSLRVTRYLYPENFSEKSQYVSTNLLIPQYEVDSESKNAYDMYNIVYGDSENRLRRTIIPYEWDTKLPTNPVNDPTLGFKPILLIGVLSGDGPSYKFQDGRIVYGNNLKPTTFCLDFSIDVTFRGLRYTKMVE